MSEKTIERQVIDQILELKTKNEKELVGRLKILEEEKEYMRMEYEHIISELKDKLECAWKENEWLLSDIYHIQSIIKEGDHDK
ncbi:hypothetical protein ML092_004987 [Klebsiella pneumoniae]|nr:hypothetical protein [Klebsiella pneumoniae]